MRVIGPLGPAEAYPTSGDGLLVTRPMFHVVSTPAFLQTYVILQERRGRERRAADRRARRGQVGRRHTRSRRVVDAVTEDELRALARGVEHTVT